MDSDKEENDDSSVSESVENVDVDLIINDFVKPCGKWQLLIVILTALSTSASPTVSIFLLGKPYFRCRLSEMYEQMIKNSTFEEAAAYSGPWVSDANIDGQIYANEFGCFKYEYPGKIQSTVSTCDNGYIYKSPEFQYPDTIVKEWDLVCDRSWLVPMSNTLFLLGMSIGFFTGGYLSTLLGRRLSIVSISFCHLVFAFSTSLCGNYWSFVFVRFLLALCLSAKTTAAIVLINECTTAPYRTTFLTIHFLFIDIFNRIYVPLFAYMQDDWRIFNAVAMLSNLVVLTYPFIIPESPRWLLSKDNEEECLNTLYHGYLINSRKFFKRGLEIDFKKEEKLSILFHDSINAYQSHRDKSFFERLKANFVSLLLFRKTEMGKPGNFLHTSYVKLLFISRTATENTMICIGLYIIHNMLHFGLMFYIRFMKASVYMVTTLNVLIIIPSFLLTWILPKIFKSRKLPLYFCYALASCFALFGGVYQLCFEPETDVVLITMANLAFLCTTSAAVLMFVYVPELFASDIRAQGLGLTIGAGRLFSLSVDFLNELDSKFGHGLPLIIYGILFIAQLFLFLLAPESNGMQLHDKTSRSRVPSPQPQPYDREERM